MATTTNGKYLGQIDALSRLAEKAAYISPGLYEEYDVKRGLRDPVL